MSRLFNLFSPPFIALLHASVGVRTYFSSSACLQLDAQMTQQVLTVCDHTDHNLLYTCCDCCIIDFHATLTTGGSIDQHALRTLPLTGSKQNPRFACFKFTPCIAGWYGMENLLTFSTSFFSLPLFSLCKVTLIKESNTALEA